MNIQRLRNLTTGYLHTEIDHVYKDLGWIIGEQNLMTYMLPMANRAVEPWLRKYVIDARFWDRLYDPTHQGEYALPEPTAEARKKMISMIRKDIQDEKEQILNIMSEKQ